MNYLFMGYTLENMQIYLKMTKTMNLETGIKVFFRTNSLILVLG